jgi:DNA adenine methylase
MKTPISYYGGKARIASAIVPCIHAIPHTVYAEPFAGGLSILYAKGKYDRGDADNYREAINDTNQCLITFWKVAREQPEELAKWLQLTPYSQFEYQRAREIYNNPSEHLEIEIAWATYIRCNMSFSNKIDAGWGTGTISRNHASTWVNRANRLPQCFERLKEVYIGCEDALLFIKRWDSPQTLFYCDPPYPGTNQGHYSGYSIEDYAALCNALDICEGSYILSNYSHIAPKSTQKEIDIEARMSAANGKDRGSVNIKRVEKLWICDRSKDMRSDIAKIAKMPDRSVVQQLSLI